MIPEDRISLRDGTEKRNCCMRSVDSLQTQSVGDSLRSQGGLVLLRFRPRHRSGMLAA
jgi:hypothetical protein